MFWIPFFNHNLPIRLDFGQDLYRLCGLLNPVRLPSATGNPRKLSLSFLLTHKKEPVS